MALWHGGAPKSDIQRWMAKYQQQLEPLQPKPLQVNRPEETWGDLSAYGGLVPFFDRELEQFGETDVLNRHLPGLLSGWVADAFHPLIRLGYARRFGCRSEISAGLAYLAARGPNRRLLFLAESAAQGEIRWPAPVTIEGRTFNERLDHYLERHAPVVRLPRNPVAAYAHDALDILNASHDFFALHLVTALHAFVCATEGLSGISPKLLAAGMTIGYAAAGFPPLKTAVAATPFHSDFEHDVKLAFACGDYATMTGDEKYRAAAAVFRLALPKLKDQVDTPA